MFIAYQTCMPKFTYDQLSYNLRQLGATLFTVILMHFSELKFCLKQTKLNSHSLQTQSVKHRSTVNKFRELRLKGSSGSAC